MKTIALVNFYETPLHWRFQIWKGGFYYKTTSLVYVQNNPQHIVDEISDSQDWTYTGLNGKTARWPTHEKKYYISYFSSFLR